MLLPEVFDTVLFNSADDSDLDAPFSCDLATSNYWLTLSLSIFDEFQLDMVAHRLVHEYGVKARIMGSHFNLARWVTNDDASAHLWRWTLSTPPRCWWTTAPCCARWSSNGSPSGFTRCGSTPGSCFNQNCDHSGL